MCHDCSCHLAPAEDQPARRNPHPEGDTMSEIQVQTSEGIITFQTAADQTPATDSERVEQIRARVEATTEGPWAVWRDLDHQGFYTVGDEAGVLAPGESADECNPTAHVYIEPDAKFIAHAPEDVRYLLALLAEQAATIERARGLHRPMNVWQYDDVNGVWGTDEHGERILIVVACRECTPDDVVEQIGNCDWTEDRPVVEHPCATFTALGSQRTEGQG